MGMTARSSRKMASAIHAGIGVQKPQPSGGVVPVGGAASFLVDSCRDDHQHCVDKVGIAASAQFHCRGKGRAVLEICHDALGALMILIQHDNLAGNSPHDEGKKTSRAYSARSNDADF